MGKLTSTNVSSASIHLSLLILRVGVALFMLIGHGLPKITRLTQSPVEFMDFMGIGPTASLALTVFAEVGCSFLILIGLLTRLAVIPLLITMFVAVFVAHAGDPFVKIEMALHYILVYFVLLVMGSGKYSVDKFIK